MEPHDSVAEQIEQARRESVRTGARIRRRVEKRRFLEEFPHAASSPLMALTDPVFDLDFTPLEAMSVGQLRTLCLKKKGLPLALRKVLQVEGYPDSQTVYILKEEARLLAEP
jgi:hypothetical protein